MSRDKKDGGHVVLIVHISWPTPQSSRKDLCSLVSVEFNFSFLGIGSFGLHSIAKS